MSDTLIKKLLWFLFLAVKTDTCLFTFLYITKTSLQFRIKASISAWKIYYQMDTLNKNMNQLVQKTLEMEDGSVKSFFKSNMWKK